MFPFGDLCPPSNGTAIMTNVSRDSSVSPALPVFFLGTCYCCRRPINMGERHHIDHHGRMRCGTHAPSIGSQFFTIVAALHTALHSIWKDPEAVRDALVDADVLRAEITGAKPFFLCSKGRTSTRFLKRIDALANPAQRDLWVETFATELEAFRSLANALADGSHTSRC